VLSNQLPLADGGKSGSNGGGVSDDRDRLRGLKAGLSRRAAGPSTAHASDILDMKAIEFPQKMLATAGRDGIIKIWI